jgi:hypothetical protein
MKNLGFILVVIGYTAGWAAFGPNIRVDHQNLPNHITSHAAITLGLSDSLSPPIYVVFQDDSLEGVVTVRSDIYFQKSTDGGATFLPQDVLVRRGETFACYPDIITDQSGNIYIIYTERLPGPSLGHIYCTRSTDQGVSWSTPRRIDDNSSPVMMGWAKIAVDTGGDLFVAWNDGRMPYLHIWSSVSSDSGVNWRTNVRVSGDTISSDRYQPDVAVCPTTNFYLVTFSSPYYARPNLVTHNSVFTKSTDGGITFSPPIVLDTFTSHCGQPHIVASENFIIASYSGYSGGLQIHSQARTSNDFGISWTPPVPLTNLETLYSSYYNGARLAIDPSGNVHTALMVCDIVTWNYEIYYAFSTDQGLTWSEREIVNEATYAEQYDPDIAVDLSGFAYIVFEDHRNQRGEIWFATNHPLALSEKPTKRMNSLLIGIPTIFRNKTLFHLTKNENQINTIRIYNITGNLVRKLIVNPDSQSLVWNGLDDWGRRCPSGVYVVKAEKSGRVIASGKVVLLHKGALPL